MRPVLLLTGSAALVVSLVVGFFAFSEANQQQLDLTTRLQSRSFVLAESLSESVEPAYVAQATSSVQRIIDRFVTDERLAGLGVFDNRGVVVAASEDLPLPDDTLFITRAMDSDEPGGEFVRRGEVTYYTYVLPLHDEGRVVGALAVTQNATYIDESIRSVWMSNLARGLAQIAVFVIVIFILVRWVFFRSIASLTESVRAVRKGDGLGIGNSESYLQPLTGELAKVAQSLLQARRSASEEARMRLEKIDSPWTAERLKEFIKTGLKNRPVFVLTNREPYVHTKTKNKISVSVPASGVITALEPVMEACGGTWIAYGSGTADKETADEHGKLAVPPEEPNYTLKRVWLTPSEVKGYYTGFSNEAIYPLCLMAHVRPIFRADDWKAYKSVNAKFAKTLLDEIRHVERPIVLVQDYHLALVPAIIKKSRPDAVVAIYWHIPWPSAAQFSICPWKSELLNGMLGADIVGFQTQQHCNNFIDTVANEVESRIDYEEFSITRAGHRSYIKPFPISIAYPGSAEVHGEPDRTILQRFGVNTEHVILGVDRLDYTKGFLERFKGLEFLLDAHPEYREHVTMLQVASPTRESVEKYREYASRVLAEVQRINEKFGTRTWKPIIFEHVHHSHEELAQLYRQADICLITSLHDGMNLVAKEFVAARSDEEGVLMLSQFTGASRDLKGALLVNPYSAEETSAILHTALTMPKSEQHRRMTAMRSAVRDYNVYRWSAELLKALAKLD